jgi:hypothetical protein
MLWWFEKQGGGVASKHWFSAYQYTMFISLHNTAWSASTNTVIHFPKNWGLEKDISLCFGGWDIFNFFTFIFPVFFSVFFISLKITVFKGQIKIINLFQILNIEGGKVPLQ